jgi:hypothetical protein
VCNSAAHCDPLLLLLLPLLSAALSPAALVMAGLCGGQAGKQAGRQGGKETGKQAGRQGNRQAGKQAGNKTGRQASKQAGKETGKKAETCQQTGRQHAGRPQSSQPQHIQTARPSCIHIAPTQQAVEVAWPGEKGPACVQHKALVITIETLRVSVKNHETTAEAITNINKDIANQAIQGNSGLSNGQSAPHDSARGWSPQ